MIKAAQTRSWRRAALRVGGSVATLAVLFAILPVGELWAAMRRVPLALWFLVMAGYLSAQVIGVIKWRLMVNLAGAGLGFAQAARCHFAGLFGNIFLPSIVGGDVIRAGLALRLGRNKPGVLLGSLLDRILDVAALAGVAACGALLLPGALDPRGRKIFWAIAASFAVGAVASLALLAALPRRRLSYRWRRRMVRLRQAARSMSRQPQYVLLALSFGLVIQTSLVVLMAQIGAACGLDVLLRVWLFAYPLAKLSALLPVTQGGIGVREAALAALLAPFGAPVVLTVAVGLVWEAVIITSGLLAGLLSLLVGRFTAAGPIASAEISSVAGDGLVIPRS